MKYLIEKDKFRRILFYKKEYKIKLIKIILKDKRHSLFLRLRYKLMLNSLSRNFSKTRIVNRCFLTGRANSTYRFFRMSRLQIRDFALRGLLYGIKKSSW